LNSDGKKRRSIDEVRRWKYGTSRKTWGLGQKWLKFDFAIK
jgi:hypothetical protein